MTLTTVNPALLDTQAQYTGFKNRIINGAMVIDQRNAGASVSISASAKFSCDRFETRAVGGGVVSAQRSTTAPAGFINSVLLTVTTADSSVASTDDYKTGQIIEGFNISDFGWGTANAVAVTVSFWVRSSITGTYVVALQNDAENRSYPATYTINAANTFEYKTVIIAGDTTGTWLTDNGKGVRVNWNLGSGSSYNGTANAWNASDARTVSGATNWIGTSGATFYITGVQLEKGSTATAFDYRPYGTELALCQRYYSVITAYFYTSSNMPIYYKVSMRANPTVTGENFLTDSITTESASAYATINGMKTVTIAAEL